MTEGEREGKKESYERRLGERERGELGLKVHLSSVVSGSNESACISSNS